MPKTNLKQREIDSATSKTINDFGAQWTDYTENEGYYASQAMFEDIMSGLIDITSIQGTTVADIGSGSGRIVGMLLDAGAAHVKAIEPSAAMTVLQENLKDRASQIDFVHDRGEAIGQFNDLDFVTSIGVLHHIPDPAPVVSAAYKALKSGGAMAIWLYAEEGNELYLAFARPLRVLTQRLPDFALKVLCHTLNLFLNLYIALCRFLPLPMHTYMRDMLGKLSWKQRYLTIYDQLNPCYAKYYKQDEATALLETAGFKNVRIKNRHGYSWAVVGEKI